MDPVLVPSLQISHSTSKGRKEVRFSGQKLSYPALYNLIHFFYSDSLEVAVDDMEDLGRTSKACKSEELQKILQKELERQTLVECKSLKEVDNSQKRFILLGLSLPEQDRLPSALNRILETSLANPSEVNTIPSDNDLAAVCIKVGRIFCCHQVILASRSEYFKARLMLLQDTLCFLLRELSLMFCYHIWKWSLTCGTVPLVDPIRHVCF